MYREQKIKLIIGILLMIAILSGSCLGLYFFSLRRASNEFADLAKTFHGGYPQSNIDNLNQSIIENKNEKMAGFDNLYDKNNDLIGWIIIPGTDIDYPVMYTPEEPEYYLRRNFEKKYSIKGTLFIDGKCSLQPRSGNIVIHGHNMKDGSMFADLMLYEEKEFQQSHPEIQFYFFGKKQTYDIIAAFRTEVYNDKLEFKYNEFVDFQYKVQFEDYITKAKKAALYETGITAQPDDHLLTLSTCAYHTTHGRFVVLARERKE